MVTQPDMLLEDTWATVMSKALFKVAPNSNGLQEILKLSGVILEVFGTWYVICLLTCNIVSHYTCEFFLLIGFSLLFYLCTAR